MRILVNMKLTENLRNKIKENVTVDVAFAEDEEQTLDEISDVEGFFGFLTPEMFGIARKIRWYQVPRAGLERYMFPELVESDIIVTNTPAIYNEEIASHVFAFITAFSRDLPKLIRLQEQKIWANHEKIKSIPLFDKTLGIIGLGGIGTEVAKIANAFQMRVVATRAHQEKGRPAFVDELWGPEGLDDLLKQSDFVVVCTPQNPSTVKMIGAKQFSEMKKDAFFINVGRGMTVDTDALVQALRRQQLAGAGLDVVDPEPLPQTHPLWSFENVIITPHSSAILKYLYDERRVNIFLQNLERFIQGKHLLHEVDKRTLTNIS